MGIKNKFDYVIDLDAVMNFVFQSENGEIDSEVTEVYIADDDTNELHLSTKQLRENKNKDGIGKTTIRYDIIKLFLSMISTDESNFGSELVLNTLKENGLIKII